MDRPKKNFRSCVLSSRLVTPAELDQTIVALWTERSGGRQGTQIEISERELADHLIKLGKLTPYQAESLLAGNTKLFLSNYKLLESIGHGGMGQVFKAEHTFMGRIVAVKVLPRLKATPEAVASFLHEIKAQAKLHHENLVQAFDAGQDKYYFLVTEYVPGSDLRKYIRQHGPLDMQASATIITQAARGLGHAHEQGLVHRDVKPGNLLVTPEGKTKVSDLGLAGWMDDADNDPRAGKIVGTADYLSPEQILTPRQVGPASDIYSLGCTLYYAVTGKVPFPGGSTRDKARRHIEDMPLHPRRLNPELTDKFVDVIAEMMEKKPEERIQTCAEVADRLSQWAEDRVAAPLPEAPEAREESSFSYQLAPIEDMDGGEDLSALPETDWQLDDGLSQSSQGTEAFAEISEETVPAKSDIWLAPRRHRYSREFLILAFAGTLAGFALLLTLIHLIIK
jgi:serine/threonine protein kinase